MTKAIDNHEDETLEDKYAEAYMQSSFDETGLNGKAIDWRYWVHKKRALNSIQAACLMSALDPKVFKNLDGKPGMDDPTRNIEKAKMIQEFAEDQGKLTASPAEWVEWAQSERLKVHTGFRLAVWELSKATGENTPKVKAVATQKRQRHDALAAELDVVLSSSETRTPTAIMAKLREKVGNKNTCILDNVGDGITWENGQGEIKTLTIKNLGERIREWKKTALSQG